MRRRHSNNRVEGRTRRGRGVLGAGLLVAAALGSLTVRPSAASAADPVVTTTTVAPSATTTTATTVAPGGATAVPGAPTVAAVSGAATAGPADPSRRSTGARGHFAAKQAAILPRPVSSRGTTSEPVAVLAIELGRAIDAGASAAQVATLRGKLAGVVAGRVKSATAAQLDAAWAATTPTRLTVLLTALAQVGKRYQYNSAGPDSFDCSGLVLYAWAEVGVKLPHNDQQQINAVAPRTEATMTVADLAEYPGHVALYLGVGKAIVHAEQTGVPVRVTDYSAATRFGSPLP